MSLVITFCTLPCSCHSDRATGNRGARYLEVTCEPAARSCHCSQRTPFFLNPFMNKLTHERVVSTTLRNSIASDRNYILRNARLRDFKCDSVNSLAPICLYGQRNQPTEYEVLLQALHQTHCMPSASMTNAMIVFFGATGAPKSLRQGASRRIVASCRY